MTWVSHTTPTLHSVHANYGGNPQHRAKHSLHFFHHPSGTHDTRHDKAGLSVKGSKSHRTIRSTMTWVSHTTPTQHSVHANYGGSPKEPASHWFPKPGFCLLRGALSSYQVAPMSLFLATTLLTITSCPIPPHAHHYTNSHLISTYRDTVSLPTCHVLTRILNCKSGY